MPLQIRRGTEAERLAIAVPLAPGELLYTTDDKRIYVGDGTTANKGGIMVTGYTDENAQDAIGAILETSPHVGISFDYNDLAGTLSATVDLSTYTGPISASAVKSTVVGDDSTILVDGVSSKINLDGTVKGNIVPDANEVYDIGSASNRFRDLYLSGSSIKLGAATITATGSAVNLPAGSTINGSPLGIPTDTSLTVDVQGSVFADDSSILVDSIDKVFYGSVDLGDVILSNNAVTGNNFFIGTDADPISLLGLTLDNNLQLRMITDPVNGKFITFSQSRGTFEVPAAVQAGDLLGGLLMRAYTSSTNSAISGLINFVVDSTSIVDGSSQFIKSKIFVGTCSDTGYDDTKTLTVDSDGVVSAPIMKVGSYDSALETSITPEIGMIIYNTDLNKFRGYTNTGWVNLS